MKITFLGTGSMMPTKERNHTGILISYGADNILVDCGEGIQRQFRLAGVSPTKVTKILITHWHADHILGLPGLITTLAHSQYSKTLEVYGPRRTKYFFKRLFEAYVHQDSIKVKVTEVEKGKFFEGKDFYLEALPLDHGAPCLGYSFVEKDKRKINLAYLRKYGLRKHPILKDLQQGKSIVWKGKKIDHRKATKIKSGRKVSVILDTVPCANAVRLAKDSDLLICEATHAEDIKDKSRQYKHMTAMQAARIAKKAKVKRLILTHFSQRYKTTNDLVREAKSVFKDLKAAKDFLIVSV